MHGAQHNISTNVYKLVLMEFQIHKYYHHSENWNWQIDDKFLNAFIF